MVMGGIEIVPNRKSAVSKNRTLTPAGAVLLIKLGILVPIQPIEAINDKSKADLLAKLLVCIQGIWMLAQALGRKITGLPLTLLELNTIMHVVCALLMYLLWFKKPQDVQTPLEFDADDELGSPLELVTCLTLERTEIYDLDEPQRKFKVMQDLNEPEARGKIKAREERAYVQALVWEEGLGYHYHPQEFTSDIDRLGRYVSAGRRIWNFNGDKKTEISHQKDGPQDHPIQGNPTTVERAASSGYQTTSRANQSITTASRIEAKINPQCMKDAQTPHLEPEESSVVTITEFTIITKIRNAGLYFSGGKLILLKEGLIFWLHLRLQKGHSSGTRRWIGTRFGKR